MFVGKNYRELIMGLLDPKMLKHIANLPEFVLSIRDTGEDAEAERATSTMSVTNECKTMVKTILDALKLVKDRDKIKISKDQIPKFVKHMHHHFEHDSAR